MHDDERRTTITDMTLLWHSSGDPTVDALGGPPPLPHAARLTFLPIGGRLELQLAGTWRTLDLSELRFRMVAVLLGQPWQPEAFVADERLLRGIWPRETRGRVDLNQLLHRTRHAFRRAGLEAGRLIERAPRGGGTRFRLAAGARVDFGQR